MIGIPVLIVLTIVVIFQAIGGQSASTPPVAAGDAPTAAVAANPQPTSVTTLETVGAPQPTSPTTGAAEPPATTPAAPGAVADPAITDAQGTAAAAITAGALPAGATFVAKGKGTWHVVPGRSRTVGTGEQRSTYTIEVEDGLESAAADQQFATAVDATLADRRSWIGGGQVSLTRIVSGDPDFRISLTSQQTIRGSDKCGFDVPLEASCFNGWVGRVFINDARWVRGAMSYDGDLTAYRSYAVNHEVGHALGHRHEPCPAQGAAAPVMMQQSWSTSNNDLNQLDPDTVPHDGKVCRPNPFPYPAAATVASATTAASAAAG